MSLRHQTYNTKVFLDSFNDTTIYYDPKFQRNYGAWDLATKRSFIISVNLGHNLQNICLIDIREALKWTRTYHQNDTMTIDYYVDLLQQGFEYISLDGQHRSKVLAEFIDDKFAISGEFYDADEKIVVVDNYFFSQLPIRMQDRFNSFSSIPVMIKGAGLASGLSRIFINLQQGENLNNQEVRQANFTPVSDWIRISALKSSSGLRRIFTEQEEIRRITDETVAKIAMELIPFSGYESCAVSKGYSFSKDDIDKWYALGNDFLRMSDPGCPYKAEEFERVGDILNIFSSLLLQQKVYSPSQRIPKKYIWPVLHACEWICDNGMYSYDPIKSFEIIKLIDNELEALSEIQFNKDKAALLRKGKDPDSISKRKYYWRQTQIPHQKDARIARKNVFLEEFKKQSNLAKAAVRAKKAAA